MTAVLDRDGFQAVLVGILGCLPTSVVWDTDPEPFVSDQDRYIVKLDVFNMSPLGVDEHRRSYGPPGFPSNAYVTQELGNRDIMLTVKVEAFDKGVDASEIIDVIRTAIRAEPVRDQLNALNLAFVESHGSVRVKNFVDTRVVNTAIADFKFAGIAQRTTSVVVDGTTGPQNPGGNGGYIATVDGNNKIPGSVS